MFSLLGLTIWPLTLVQALSQQTFSYYEDLLDNSTAPFIFNSLSSLLSQWPNTYHGNGHTIIPGVIDPYTLLYHARNSADLPPSSEWLAFDPEMSFGIFSWDRPATFLATYRTLRPARIIYFDGMSAALNFKEAGWLDSQEVFMAGRGRLNESDKYDIFDEPGRLTKLCKWAKQVNLDGIVRMNSGFEVMWCDFDSPTLQLVSYLNITPPGHPPPIEQPDEDEFPWSPIGIAAFSEWFRASAQRGMSPQPHVHLDYSSFVTFYHPRLRSLAGARGERTMRQHRIWNDISVVDAQSVRSEVEEVVQRPGWPANGSGMNWAALAQNIVEEWANRIMQLHEFLGNTSTPQDDTIPVNTTYTLLTLRRLTYSPLSPFIDTSVSNASVRDWIFGASEIFSENHLFPLFPTTPTNSSMLRRCMYSATGLLHDPRIDKTPQEALLRMSVETVLERLCTDYGVLFVDSMEANEEISEPDLMKMIDRWATRIDALMHWLDWTVWLRCNEACSSNSICTMPMWPVNGFDGWDDDDMTPLIWKHQCVDLSPEALSEPLRYYFNWTPPQQDFALDKIL
ncbi:uncharacterized protein FIBRA_08276 [Fibroporia radiculosa]|uniref:Uncharacterized protein n=1 Tax=Fibroporia radiculosa TaxID=599839 RepID=J4IC97_9APHY|nr:uncharacterized protein FIBRA_08276 [Fibroporia radiculosa]CCM06031.1 predicted protein [Fibroporia radiculosa]